MPEITLIFATILSSFMIGLSFRVLDLRGSPVTKFLHKPNKNGAYQYTTHWIKSYAERN